RGAARGAPTRRRARGDRVPLARGPDREARVPRVEPELRLPPGLPGLSLPRARAGRDAHPPGGRAGPRRGRAQPARPERAPARVEEGGVSPRGPLRPVIAVAALLLSLGLVVWRQA